MTRESPTAEELEALRITNNKLALEVSKLKLALEESRRKVALARMRAASRAGRVPR